MSQEKFTPKYELGTSVYVVEVKEREVYEGVITIARLEKIPYKDEYGNFYFESKNSYAKPSFKENYDINCRLGSNWKIINRFEDEIFSTPEDAMNYLSKVILKKFKSK